MLIIRKVAGESMLPAYRPGDVVLALKRRPRVGSVVIAQQNGREVLKRIIKIEAGEHYLQGDNMKKSTDSRTLGPVKAKNILGKVIAKLPASVAPVSPRHAYARIAGYGLALVMTVLALVHLFRIDTLVEVMDGVYPGDLGFAAFLVAVSVCAEVFALPYLMAMRLSPLGHVVSGLMAIAVPLHWLLISIWGLGQGFSTGQLGEFVNLPASWWLVVINIIWLAASYWLLWLRNFDSQTQLLRK